MNIETLDSKPMIYNSDTAIQTPGEEYKQEDEHVNVENTEKPGHLEPDTPAVTGNFLNDFIAMFRNLFNKSNFVLLLWFLAIYGVAYFFFGLFFSKSAGPEMGGPSSFQINLGRMLDIIILTCILIFIISAYYSYPEEKKDTVIGDTATYVKDFFNKPYSIVSVGVFLVVFYIVLYLFRIPLSADAKPVFVSIIENIAWISFLILAFIDFFKYVLGIPLMDAISQFFGSLNPKPEESEKVVDASGTIMDLSGALISAVQPDEVFNVSNNLYTFDDAQAICTSYGAKMATYDQIEKAYNDGAEWCNYGWSDGQMIFFPTQKSTWDKLQQTKKHKNDCGRPGVNGGYIANPYLKFGVNCYGKKPKPGADELARLQSIQAKTTPVYPKSPEDIELEKKVDYWKQNADKLLKINSYNNDKWFQNNNA